MTRLRKNYLALALMLAFAVSAARAGDMTMPGDQPPPPPPPCDPVVAVCPNAPAEATAAEGEDSTLDLSALASGGYAVVTIVLSVL